MIRFGILGAAGITPLALVEPARDNPDVELTAVAARDRGRAEDFAAEHGITRVHDSYDDILADPEVDAVYIPLANSQHGSWTVAALEAGKHVLVEKPFASNVTEAEAVAAAAAEHPDLVVMEAFHYRYHQLMETVIDLVREGAVGDLVDVSATFNIHLPDRSNIRYNYDLAGGATMDLGCYCLHFMRSVVGEEPQVISAEARPSTDPRVDEALIAQLRFPSGVTGTLSNSLLEDEQVQAATIPGTRGRIEVRGFVHPQFGNSVTVITDDGERAVEVPETPTTYAAQLTAFVAAVSDGGPVLTDPADSVAEMRVIDAMYEAAGLGARTATGR